MPIFPPGETTYLDRFNRADGTVYAGAGASLWATTRMDGSPSDLLVTGNRLGIASGTGGGLTTESVADGIRIFLVTATSSNYLRFLFRVVPADGFGGVGHAYALDMIGGNWTLYAVTSGTIFTPVDTHSATDTLASGSRVGIRFEGDEVEVYLGGSHYFNADPVWTSSGLTNTDAGACGFEMSTNAWRVDDYASGGLTFPTTPVTIYVDPDHVAADDSYNRTQASNPATPMRTAQEACWLARATPTWADTILIKRCLTHDFGDPKDPHLQPILDYRSNDRTPQAISWPFGDNTGNEPITIRGDVTPPVPFISTAADAFDNLPKLKGFWSRGLANWTMEDLQFGYDQDSGDDWRTLSPIERCADLTWRRCLFTGGMATVDHWAGVFMIDKCKIRAKMPPPTEPGGIHDGRGLGIGGNPGEGSGYSIGQLTVQDSYIDHVRGDDAINVGGMEDPDDPLYDIFDMHIVRNVFHNVNGDSAYHTDCIQILGVPRCVVDSNVFFACDQALTGSDYRNGYVQFTRNLTIGIDTPFQMQGTAELVIQHNTFNHADCGIQNASLLFYDRAVMVADTVATITNNIIGGFFMRDRSINDYFGPGTVIENNIVMTSPGLVSDWGTNLPGVAEFGTSSRLDFIPNDSTAYGRDLDRNWELANTPFISGGIGQGGTYTLPFSTDMFGRAFTSPPDVGSLQSSVSSPVPAAPRPPFIMARAPAPNASGVSPSTSIVVKLYPTPGAEIVAASVTTASAFVKDAANFTLPAVVSITGLDGEGSQSLVINLKAQLSPLTEGDLFPLVSYTVFLTGAIIDTNDFELLPVTWSFRVIGPGVPAIGDFTTLGSASGWTVGVIS